MSEFDANHRQNQIKSTKRIKNKHFYSKHYLPHNKKNKSIFILCIFTISTKENNTQGKAFQRNPKCSLQRHEARINKAVFLTSSEKQTRQKNTFSSKVYTILLVYLQANFSSTIKFGYKCPSKIFLFCFSHLISDILCMLENSILRYFIKVKRNHRVLSFPCLNTLLPPMLGSGAHIFTGLFNSLLICIRINES